MNSLILQIAVRVLFPILLIASLLSLFRGHHEPGGGFIGGLVAASAFVLYTFAYGAQATELKMRLRPLMFIIAGLLSAFTATLLPLLFGLGYLEAMWAGFYLPVIGRPGTPLLFDLGVYLVVIGVVCKIVFTIATEDQ